MGSDETNKLIDAEIKALVEDAHARATDILKTQEDKLHLLAQAMLEYETLTGDEIKQLLDKGRSTVRRAQRTGSARSLRRARRSPGRAPVRRQRRPAPQGA